MKNFKEIAEKCLTGKLSGTFVLRNGKVFHSITHLSTTSLYALPYYIAGWCYSVAGNCYSGGLSVKDNDIIDFILDMKKEQITIDIPEGKVPVMEQTDNGVVITWKEKELTYDGIINEIAGSPKHIIGFSYGAINDTTSSSPFYRKVEVLRKLTNIRNYFGKPDENEKGWIIEQGGIRRTAIESHHYSYHTIFAEREHAEQAIKMLGDELKYLFEPW